MLVRGNGHAGVNVMIDPKTSRLKSIDLFECKLEFQTCISFSVSLFSYQIQSNVQSRTDKSPLQVLSALLPQITYSQELKEFAYSVTHSEFLGIILWSRIKEIEIGKYPRQLFPLFKENYLILCIVLITSDLCSQRTTR